MANGSLIQILLADDDALVRQALRIALQAHPNIKVVGEAKGGEEALVREEQLRPRFPPGEILNGRGLTPLCS